MGSCVSVHKEPQSVWPLRLRFSSASSSKTDIPSPIKPTINAAADAQWSRPGSKEDAFFDSQPWLDSDCEDDFVSVRGDFTPSRESTPIHPHFPVAAPRVVTDPFSVERILHSSPVPVFSPDKRKRLSDLFKDSLRADQLAHMDQNVDAHGKGSILESKSWQGTPRLSVANSRTISDRIPNGFHRPKDEPIKSTQRCLPRFLQSHS